MSGSSIQQKSIVPKRLDAARIETRLIPLDLIDDHPENYNQHPDAQVAQLAASHEEFGQYRTIAVWARPNGRYTRVVGHGYSQGAKATGETMLRCEVYPEDTPPETIKAIMLADNLHAKNSVSDDALLAELLQQQADVGFDLASLGSSFDELDALRLLLEQTTPKGIVEDTDSAAKPTRPASVSVFLAVSSLAVIEEAIAATNAPTRGESLETLCRFYLEHHETGQ